MEDDVYKELTRTIREYPLLNRCALNYVRFLHHEPRINPDDIDLIWVIQNRQVDQLAHLEQLLNKAKAVLGIDEREFLQEYGFSNSRINTDSERIYDILFEPQVVVYLHELGFTCIRKIERQTRPTADFLARLGKRQFAVECKTVRPRDVAVGDFLQPATTPSWWLEEFVQTASRRIRNSIRQLESACELYRCDYMMPVVDIRRDLRALMSNNDYEDALKRLRGEFPKLDFIACKKYDRNGDYTTTSLMIHPTLTSVSGTFTE